ncbi:MAG: ABC transporter ATP-binding protein, partial [Desulfuromonadaceae bacterium]
DPKARRDFWEQIHELAGQGLTFLISTHYMDEAERCDRLAYLSYGHLLTQGTAPEVIAAAQLTTWSVSGPDLHALARRLRGTPGVQQAVAFGTRLHISSTDAQSLELAIAPFRTEQYAWQQINPGLEDVFIHLMESSKDNFSL